MQLMLNDTFSLATQLVNETSCNVFLTGKAGTGKTTFLKQIVKQNKKNMVVTAPTGVAAINAGGVTLHSFFRLPLLPYLPNKRYYGSEQLNFANKHQLIKNARFSKDNIEIIKALDLLIIDEVSMLRADMLDAVNDVLQYVRKNNQPFGGVQLLLIGDLLQLPPVVVEHEAPMLAEYYESPFFFHANSLINVQLITVELNKIYRQSDDVFINLLNNIRNNNLSIDDLNLLNSKYTPNADKFIDEAIILTTHNYQSDLINKQKLSELNSHIYSYSATVSGDFPEKFYPVELNQQFKVGAQVMFLKNDIGKKYHNGKIGNITKLTENEIWVKSKNDTEAFLVEPITWENKNYKLNDETKNIEEDVVGTFTQYPLKLAWSVTIHKSQGLTFDKVIIDGGKAFASGQVYVALSRCTSFDGIFLLSKINYEQIFANNIITEFMVTNQTSNDELKKVIEIEKPLYIKTYIGKVFNLEGLSEKIKELLILLPHKTISNKEEIFDKLLNIKQNILSLFETYKKFTERINEITSFNSINYHLLNERVIAAKKYFIQKLIDDFIKPIDDVINTLSKIKKSKQIATYVSEIRSFGSAKIKQIQLAGFDDLPFMVEPIMLEPKTKTEKTSTYDITLQLLHENKTIEEIAVLRGLTQSTIYAHIAHLVKTGKTDFRKYVDEKIITLIENAYKQSNPKTLSDIKNALPHDVSFNDIKIVLAFIESK